ncbi:MAG: FAD-dependent oxidoreductase [Chloroflexota bacterium]|nr:FAD-dependent oxidoreductase [Chloroflexota bacterium]
MSIPQTELERQAFPILSDEEIDLLRPFGEVRPAQVGDVLFEIGDAEYPLVVILSGQAQVIDRSERVDRIIGTSGPGRFIGELGLLTGQTVFVACVVTEPGEVLLIPPQGVREAITMIPVLSDTIVTAFAARRQMLMQSAAATLTLIGPEEAPSIVRLQEFASRNRIPHRWLPPDNPFAMQVNFMEWPPRPEAVRVLVRGLQTLRDPTNLQLAKALGLDLALQQTEPADLVVVGTGPAGLAAAVYGASEGLTTVAVDDVAIGGQAGTSSRIENYLGFPTGISGGEFAFRGEVQAIKFGARVTVPREATALSRENGSFVVRLDDKTELRGRSVVIATGARYRRLDLPNEDQFEGAGIYYAATDLEARRCKGAEVVVVGGGNAAGQAAMFMAGPASLVHLVYRGAELGRGMSQYLLSRLEHAPNVHIHTESEICALHGAERLESVEIWTHGGEREKIAAPFVFVMIGSDPCTDWLQGALDLDERGFVNTGLTPAHGAAGPLSPYQTSIPGVFAVGDVRSGSVKRVASAVGEGSVVVQAVHQYLAAAGEQ